MATKRGYYLQELERAKDNLNLIFTHVYRFEQAYRPAHPELADVALSIIETLSLIDDTLQKLHDSI